MNIVVCIKQVPDVTEVNWDPDTGALIRQGVPSIINPSDRVALEAALQLVESNGGTVTALSMGPRQVEEALREALGMGANSAVLLTDRKFAGSDTLATSSILAMAIKKIKEYDLILCGKEAIDGMTAQVGPELSVFLDIPLITYAIDIQSKGRRIQVTQKLGNLRRVLESEPPVLITVEREINSPRVPPIDLILDAYNKDIIVWNASDLEGDDCKYGLNGSPTKLRKIYRPRRLRGEVQMLDGAPDAVSRQLIGALKKKCIL